MICLLFIFLALISYRKYQITSTRTNIIHKIEKYYSINKVYPDSLKIIDITDDGGFEIKLIENGYLLYENTSLGEYSVYSSKRKEWK